MASILGNRYLSLKDERFVEDLLTDLSYYLQRNNSYRVLLFPPLNGYNRLLIHKTVQCEFLDLVTFSIGCGASRQTVVAFKIACSRGPRGIQLMNTPASPRGRGRGRQKEMSSSERVTNWVNQREARRLNKERWASRATEDCCSSGNGSDGQMSAKQEADELEQSPDKSKGKRHNVRLYVPPSLRVKKDCESKEDTHDLCTDGDAGKTTKDEMIFQRNETSNNTDIARGSVIKSYNEVQPQTLSDENRSKGRGRGRKKPEVEIYVPRALRAGQSENKFKARKHARDGFNNSDVVTQEKLDPLCYSSVSAVILPSDPTHNLPSYPPMLSEVFLSEISHDDTQHQKHEHYPGSEFRKHCDSWNSQPCLPPEVVKDESMFPSSAESFLLPTNELKNEEQQLHPESAGHSLTFEFYDPAVIAFLPSCNINSLVEGSRQCLPACKSSSPSPENVASHCTIPLASNTCPMDYENQSVSPVKNIEEHSRTIEEAEGASPQGQIPSAGTALDHNDESFSNEKSLNDRQNTENGKTTPERQTYPEIKQNDLLDNNLKSVEIVPDTFMSGDTKICDSKLGDMPEIVQNTFMSGGRIICDSKLVDTSVENSSSLPQPLRQTSKDDIRPSVQPIQSSAYQHEGQGDNQFSHCNGNVTGQVVSSDANENEEDTWDSIFDDNGDCLDESLMKELTEYVGKVEIDKPKINYLNYEPKDVDMDFTALGHILEIYDFSPDLATCDLITAFREFSSRGFDVKWVDDTHALGIFSSAIAANEALKMMHPLMKVRPMSEASKKGQSKARHCQEFLQPYKARPQTTSMAARRLVAGALGMAPQVSKEIRDQERQKLKEAKEKRRQERQQKVDIWDGSFGKCAMDDENTDSR